MRRSDREIKDIESILDVLNRCDTLRLGLYGDDYPYVFPLSFGYDYDGGKVKIYFHGAKEGLKHTLIAKNNRVCVEGDLFHAYRKTPQSYTAEYESVMGFGTIKKAEDETAVKGMELILKHCHVMDYPAEKCISMGKTKVYEITLDVITGKKRAVSE